MHAGEMSLDALLNVQNNVFKIITNYLRGNAGTWLNLLLPNTYKENETNTSGTNRSREIWESGIALMVDSLSVAAGNTAKDKRAKEASNRSQARGPIIRKPRLGSGMIPPVDSNIYLFFLSFILSFHHVLWQLIPFLCDFFYTLSSFVFCILDLNILNICLCIFVT